MRQAMLAILVTAPLFASAGEIYGAIGDNGRPVAAGELVTITCGSQSASGSTDQWGSYRVHLRTVGTCSLVFRGMTVEVRSYENPVRYNLEVRTEAGKPVLKRR